MRQDCLFIYNISLLVLLKRCTPQDRRLGIDSHTCEVQVPGCNHVGPGFDLAVLIHLLCDPLPILPCETGTIHLTANTIIPVFGYEPHDL
ncbi:hypothetical protein J3E68DRAFT_415573 [Trichoderma sp. SZMC 28012]